MLSISPKFLKQNKFKIAVASSLLFIVVLWLFNDDDEGSYSMVYYYNPEDVKPKTTQKKTPAFVKESRGEKECRRVAEMIFKRPFPNTRPLFLLNNVTGKELEIDCYNEELKLGIEYNGVQHYKYVPGMHPKGYEQFRNMQYRDEIKKNICEKNNFTLIVVPYTIPVENIQKYIVDQLKMHGVI